MSLRDHCYGSLGEYFLALNPAYDYVPFQQERIVPVLEGVECGDIDRLMVFMPSRHSKSDIGTKTFIPWFIGRNARKNVILLSHTQPLANDFGSAIRDTMTRNDVHRQVFPEVKVDNGSHAKDFFKTNRGNSFYAFGVNAGVPGRGGDLIVIDDPIATMEDAQSELVQHNLYETYKAVLKQRLQANGKIVLLMTRWGMRDIAARILADEGSRWKVLVLKAQEPDPTKCDGCAQRPPQPHDCLAPYLWESLYGRERYDEAKKDSYIWNSMWQQVPEPRLSQGFSEEWLRFYEPKERQKIDRYNAYIFVDPAMGKSAAHDRTAMLVLIAGPEKKVFLVDAVLDRLDPSERIAEVIRLCRIWKPLQVAYEEYALSADSHFLKLEMEKEGITDVVVTSVGRKGIKGMDGGRLTKHDRIMQLQPDFRDGKIWLPKAMPRKLMDGTEIDVVSYFINQEYLPYAGEGSIEHDDMIDCLSRIHDQEVMMQFAESAKDREENYDTGGSTGSWESNY